MRSVMLIILALEVWSGNACFSGCHTSSKQRRQAYPSYQYNPPTRSWHYPNDTRDNFQGSNLDQSYMDYRYDPNYADLISRSVLRLAHKIGTQIESLGPSKSQIFSPVSIASALTLLLLGSKGQTHEELLQLFGFDQEPLYTSKPYKIHEDFGLMIEDLLLDEIHPSRARSQPYWKYTYKKDFFRHQRTMTSSSPDDHVVRVANGIFIQNGFSLLPDYKTVVEQVYKSEITPLDFQGKADEATNYINYWVNEKTHGKIPTIISDRISSDTNVIIASALYFKALWETEFLEGASSTSDFYPDGRNGPSIKVQLMANGGVFPFYDASEYGCRIIGLPYKKNLSTAYIIMPYDSSRTKLRELQGQLTADKIEYMISRMTRKTAIIALPRMHIENSISLKRVLSELGVKALFRPRESDLSLISSSPGGNTLLEQPLVFARIQTDDDHVSNSTRSKRTVTYKVESSNAGSREPLRLKDFVLNKRITKLNPGKKRNRRQTVDYSSSIQALEELRKSLGLDHPPLFVDEVVHKVDLVVNEKGTEGGAATVVLLSRSGPEVLFRADTPFMILIRHDTTKLPLFYGTVYEPVDF